MIKNRTQTKVAFFQIRAHAFILLFLLLLLLLFHTFFFAAWLLTVRHNNYSIDWMENCQVVENKQQNSIETHAMRTNSILCTIDIEHVCEYENGEIEGKEGGKTG